MSSASAMARQVASFGAPVTLPAWSNAIMISPRREGQFSGKAPQISELHCRIVPPRVSTGLM